jgi:hypothetical protein
MRDTTRVSSLPVPRTPPISYVQCPTPDEPANKSVHALATPWKLKFTQERRGGQQATGIRTRTPHYCSRVEHVAYETGHSNLSRGVSISAAGQSDPYLFASFSSPLVYPTVPPVHNFVESIPAIGTRCK